MRHPIHFGRHPQARYEHVRVRGVATRASWSDARPARRGDSPDVGRRDWRTLLEALTGVCLLIAITGLVPRFPLVVAANRDEYRSRAATPMTHLGRAGDALAILGGRDEVAGGTWLATNEAGVVAGLTNRPLPDGPDTAKRSRGELPLVLARHATAAEAVAAFRREIDPSAYNPAWLLVADRRDLFFVDVTGTVEVGIERRPRGVVVLENRNLHEPSAKVQRVRELLDPVVGAPPAVLVDHLRALLSDHWSPPDEPFETSTNPRLARAVRAVCVHADEDAYGTRSSAVITVANDAAPTVRWTDGPPCQASWNGSDWRPPSGDDDGSLVASR
jgi:uncharacterized protein with NRDE domain